MANTVTFTGTQDTVRGPLAVTTAGLNLVFPVPSRRIQVSCDGGNDLRLYRNLADFTADQNFIELASGTGFYDGSHVGKTFYMRAVTGSTTCTFVVYYTDGLAVL